MGRYRYRSIYAEHISKYLEYKRSLGFKMSSAEDCLRQFDRFAAERGEKTIGISKEVFDEWNKKRPTESDSTRYSRVFQVRNFSGYLQWQGYNSYMPRCPKYKSDFVPHIYTKAEIEAIFRECDKLYCRINGKYTVIPLMPCLIRLLYSTGIRIGEALNLKNDDVCFDDATLKLVATKNGQERYIPMSVSMNEVCRDYYEYKLHIGLECNPGDYYFTRLNGQRCSKNTIGKLFGTVLYRAGIPYGGQKARLHDLRHTFCVNALVKMIDEGLDLYTAMPILMTYMGHQSIKATNRYIRVTQEMYPGIINKMDSVYTNMFPEIIDATEEEEDYDQM